MFIQMLGIHITIVHPVKVVQLFELLITFVSRLDYLAQISDPRQCTDLTVTG